VARRVESNNRTGQSTRVRHPYCFSHTPTLLIGRPSASVPLVVTVAVLPSLETFRVRVCTTFPPFLAIRSVVLASRCFSDTGSANGINPKRRVNKSRKATIVAHFNRPADKTLPTALASIPGESVRGGEPLAQKSASRPDCLAARTRSSFL
jgi:hypothetical protein